MNTGRVILLLIILCSCVTLGYAQEGSIHPHMGVLLDPTPLPELLTKHLGLKPDQGIRIRNINVGSPADKAGLERDDIIVSFQGQDVNDVKDFVQAVRTIGTNEDVSLEIIHLGQRKTLMFKLVFPAGDMEFKYPTEPEIITSWRPGDIFQLDPNGSKWLKMPKEQIPEMNFNMKEFFKERYCYHHTTGGQDYTVTIEGDPQNEQTEVVVEVGQNEYSVTVGSLDQLPKEYRLTVKEDVAAAVKTSKSKPYFYPRQLPKPPAPEQFQQFFQHIPRPQIDVERWSDRQQHALDKMQKQMERLQKRMEEMEKRYLDNFDKQQGDKGGPPAEEKDRMEPSSFGSTT